MTAPRFGQDQPFANPLEQRDAELCLEFRDLPRQCWLRQPEFAGCGGERPCFGRRVEGAGRVAVEAIHAEMSICAAKFRDIELLCLC